jgi:hypothetical protein
MEHTCHQLILMEHIYMEHMTLIKNETQDIDLPCHITDLGGGGGVEFDGQGKISKLHGTCASSRRHCWIILLVTAARARVCCPIYRMLLLVSAVLIQLIVIIIGTGCIKTSNTKNVDLWCRPRKEDRHQRLSSHLEQSRHHKSLETGGFHTLFRQAAKIF